MFEIKACERRHKPEKAEFTRVNDHFSGEHNAEQSDNELRNRTLPLKLSACVEALRCAFRLAFGGRREALEEAQGIIIISLTGI